MCYMLEGRRRCRAKARRPASRSMHTTSTAASRQFAEAVSTSPARARGAGMTARRTQHEDNRCEASASHTMAAGGTHGIRAQRRDREATREAMPRATPDTVRAGALEPAAARAPELRE